MHERLMQARIQGIEFIELAQDMAFHVFQLGDAIFSGVGGFMNTLDALKSAAQLQLMLTHLGFHWRHDGL